MNTNRIAYKIFLMFLCIALQADAFESLAAFKKKCDALPEFPQQFQESLVSLEEFETTCREHAATVKKQLANPASWIDSHIPTACLFDHKRTAYVYMPFVQRLIVPSKTTIALFGDLHGSIQSLMRNLLTLQKRGYLDNNGKILKKNFYMFFLGDFVDRGYYGVEVTYILMRLKIANPDQVFLVRGNHEDITLNARYGFSDELAYKFKNTKIQCTWYDMLPVALYLGCASNTGNYDYVLCCHGGLEPGFNAQTLLDYPHKKALVYQLLSPLQRQTNIEKLNDTAITTAVSTTIPADEYKNNIIPVPKMLGFLWSDFIIDDVNHDNQTSIVSYHQGRGWVFGKPFTQALLQQNSTQKSHLRGVFRAHQHHGYMLERLRKYHGMATLWNGLVHTFLSAPSIVQDASSCGFGLLTTAASYQQWHLQLIAS